MNNLEDKKELNDAELGDKARILGHSIAEMKVPSDYD